MKVILTEAYDGLFVSYKSCTEGQLIDTDTFNGERLIAAGLAEAVKSPKKKAVEKPKEKAAPKPKKKAKKK